MALFCRHEWGEVFEKRLPPLAEAATARGASLKCNSIEAIQAAYATKLILGVQCKKCGRLRISEHCNA